MKRSIATIVLLLASSANAEVLYRGKVYQVTADRIIADRQLQCTYGEWQSETTSNGSTVITRSKVCTDKVVK